MKDQMDTHELTSDILPKIKTTRHLIEHTLKARILQCDDEEERRKLTNLQQEFELETMMIQLNLNHILTPITINLKQQPNGVSISHCWSWLNRKPWSSKAPDNSIVVPKRCKPVKAEEVGDEE